jgi:predicted permease
MELIVNAINIVISIFLMMALGFVGAKRGWFDAGAKKLFSFLVVKIALPCMILTRITSSYTRDTLLEGAYGLVVPFLSMLALYAIARLLVVILRIPKNRTGVFTAMMVFSNSVFIGVPIARALFGEEVLPHTLLYYIANTILFWTLGAHGLRADGQGKAPFFSKQSLKNLASPPLVTFAVSVLIVLIGLPLPTALFSACDYVGSLVTPLSMLFVGMVLAGIRLKGLKIDRGQLAVIVGRFVLSPVFVYLLAIAFPLAAITRDAFLVQATMPVMTQVSITAGMYGADTEYATVGTTITTVLTLLVLPLLAAVLPLI